MKKFEEFINESETSRILKANPVISYLKDITENNVGIDIDGNEVSIYGSFNTPLWSKENIIESIDSTKKRMIY